MFTTMIKDDFIAFNISIANVSCKRSLLVIITTIYENQIEHGDLKTKPCLQTGCFQLLRLYTDQAFWLSSAPLKQFGPSETFAPPLKFGPKTTEKLA